MTYNMYICIYVYIHVYIYTYIHIYIYTCMYSVYKVDYRGAAAPKNQLVLIVQSIFQNLKSSLLTAYKTYIAI